MSSTVQLSLQSVVHVVPPELDRRAEQHFDSLFALYLHTETRQNCIYAYFGCCEVVVSRVSLFVNNTVVASNSNSTLSRFLFLLFCSYLHIYRDSVYVEQPSYRFNIQRVYRDFYVLEEVPHLFWFVDASVRYS